MLWLAKELLKYYLPLFLLPFMEAAEKILLDFMGFEYNSQKSGYYLHKYFHSAGWLT